MLKSTSCSDDSLTGWQAAIREFNRKISEGTNYPKYLLDVNKGEIIMSKKYELVESSKIIFGNVILYRIKALVDIPNIVKAGELGGYIESEKNLSHEG